MTFCEKTINDVVSLVFVLSRVKAAQSDLGTQILADFEEAFPSQGSKVNMFYKNLDFRICFILIHYGQINSVYLYLDNVLVLFSPCAKLNVKLLFHNPSRDQVVPVTS